MFKLKLFKFYCKLSSNLLPQYFELYRDVIERAHIWELGQPTTNKKGTHRM